MDGGKCAVRVAASLEIDQLAAQR